jgi:hypothetical protein
VLVALFVLGLVVVPLPLFAAARPSPRRRRAGDVHADQDDRGQLRLALVPIGCGVAGALRLPLPDRPRHHRAGRAEARGDRRSRLGDPRRAGVGLGQAPAGIVPLQVGAVILGGIGSTSLIHRISGATTAARREAGRRGRHRRRPDRAGLWILSQPMDMRSGSCREPRFAAGFRVAPPSRWWR